MPSLMTRLALAREQIEHQTPKDPLMAALMRAIPEGCEEITSLQLHDLVGLELRTGNNRKVAKRMKLMGWLPVTRVANKRHPLWAKKARGWARKGGHRRPIEIAEREGKRVGLDYKR